MRWLLGLTLGLGLALVAVVLAYRFLPPIGSYSPKALDYSLTLKLGGVTGFSRCRRREGSLYTCEVSNGSGGAGYRVETHGRCWTARRVAGGDFEPRATGCVRWRDQLRLGERLGL